MSVQFTVFYDCFLNATDPTFKNVLIWGKKKISDRKASTNANQSVEVLKGELYS